MEGSTSEDDFQSFMSAGSGRFRKFVNSEEEASVPSLSDAQHLEDPNEQVKMCGFKLKRAVKNEIIVVLLMAIVIVMGAGNAVASRIKGQSMGPYNFFSSLGNSVMYVATLLASTSLTQLLSCLKIASPGIFNFSNHLATTSNSNLLLLVSRLCIYMNHIKWDCLTSVVSSYVIFYYLVLFGRRIMGFTPTSDIKYPWVPYV